MTQMKTKLKNISWIALTLVIIMLAANQTAQAEEIMLWGSIDVKTAGKIAKASDGFLNPIPGELYPLTIRTLEDGSLVYQLSFYSDFFFGVAGDATFDRKGNITASNSLVASFSAPHGEIYGNVTGKFTIYVTIP
ncbi:MAG: hypothetical protein KDA78_11010 [Planctomycetaceae bacterium]|nr:hypothetical protein [Planctomycetaceae bacterium]